MSFYESFGEQAGPAISAPGVHVMIVRDEGRGPEAYCRCGLWIRPGEPVETVLARATEHADLVRIILP